jgi:hypothetical protein
VKNTLKPSRSDAGKRGDEMTLRKAIKSATTPGVTERRPIPGVVYHGFIVHPRQPGPVTVAIAHRVGEKIVLDLCRDGLTIADAANLMKAYNITKVTGANNGATASRWRTQRSAAHAALGAIHLANTVVE